MKLKRSPILILCIAVLLAAVVGCGDKDAATDSDPPDEPVVEAPPDIAPDPPQPVEPDEHIHGIDFDAAIAAFAPDVIMIKADEFYLTWADLYVFLFRSVNNIPQDTIAEIGWATNYDGDGTLAELVLEYSTGEAMLYLIYGYGAKILGITLTSDDLEMLNADIDSLIEMHGSKEALERLLRENSGVYNYEVFERLIRLEYIRDLINIELYGEDSLDFPDERVADYAERNDYMMAKHILRLKTEDDDGAALSESEDILKKLKAQTGTDNFDEFFNDMMLEHSEDPGSFSFPEGYLFQYSDMVASFSEACEALEPGEISDIVESEYGYHIIYRLPIDYDLIPFAFASAGYYLTLRQLASSEDFETVLQDWREELEIVFTPEYNSIDIATIFALCEH